MAIWLTGNREARGDHDWFTVTLNAGVTYRIHEDAVNTGVGTLQDPVMSLFNAYDANPLLTDDDSGVPATAR